MRFAVELFLDPEADAAVRAVWQSIRPDYLTPIGARPHLSLAVFTSLDTNAALPALAAFASRESGVALSLAFVGTFATDEGVVFLGPQASGDLLGLHARLHEALAGLGEPVRYYRPGTWVPHCTVAWSLAPAELGAAMDRCRRAPLPIAARATHVGLVALPDDVSDPAAVTLDNLAAYALR